MADEKEELYDVPFPTQRTHRDVPLNKKTFLATLSKAYGKPVTIKDLDKHERDVLNQVVENERVRKTAYNNLVSVLSKRKRESESFNRNKTARKGPAFWEESKRASPIHPPASVSKKPIRKGVTIVESKRASPIHPPTSASKKPARKTTRRTPSPPKSAKHLSRKRGRSKSLSDGFNDLFSKMTL